MFATSRLSVLGSLLLAGLTSMVWTAQTVAAQGLPSGFRYEPIPTWGLQDACAMSFAPDGRLFLCERLTGRVRVVRNGVLEAQPWYQINYPQAPNSEAGLLGIAVDPAFLTNGFVYLFYTDPSLQENRIARVRDVNGVGTQFTVLSPAGAMPLHPFLIHNGGRMVFGHDGRLYVSAGDHGEQLSPQDPLVWPGKVLCFDVPNLTVPANSPFPGSPAYAVGLRNSFGLAVHPTRGWLYATENGYLVGDELNRIVAGGNYGWPQFEGPGMPVGYEAPLLTLPQQPALTGMAFSAGAAYPAPFRDCLYMCHWLGGDVRRIEFSANGQNVVANHFFANHFNAFDTQLGPDGTIWVLHGQYSTGADELGRYVHNNAPQPLLHVAPVSGRSLGGSVTFGITAPNGSMAIAWVSFSTFAPPQPSAYGPIAVPTDAVLPLQFVVGDERCYFGVGLPNLPAFVGAPLNAQALTVDLTTNAVALSNPSTTVLR